MERDSEMPDLSFRFEFQRRFIRMTAFELPIDIAILRVHQIEIKVFHTAELQLPFKERTDLLLRFEIRFGQLIGQQKAAAIVPLCDAIPDRRLALSVDISVRRVEIVQPRRNERVRHAGKRRMVYLAVPHRKPHAAESENAADLGEKGILCHQSFAFLSGSHPECFFEPGGYSTTSSTFFFLFFGSGSLSGIRRYSTSSTAKPVTISKTTRHIFQGSQ